MNKKLAEIIAGMIPHKMTRNQWRGILRYGPIRALKLRIQMKKEKTMPKYYLAVCAIAKDEGQYFKEWIEWHKNLGVEKFYIYDNESTDNTKKILDPYIKSGLVDYTYFPGDRQQLAAYDDCFEKHRLEMQWLAIIDLDEFIVPVKDKTIPEFLKRFDKFSAVEINWLCYGSGGMQKKEAGNVMDRFKHHSVSNNKKNRMVKSILNPRKVCGVIGCHEVARISGLSVDSHGNRIIKNFKDREPQHDIIKINHYAVKSYEEFTEKQARGRASGTAKEISDKYFQNYDFNDVKEE